MASIKEKIGLRRSLPGKGETSSTKSAQVRKWCQGKFVRRAQLVNALLYPIWLVLADQVGLDNKNGKCSYLRYVGEPEGIGCETQKSIIKQDYGRNHRVSWDKQTKYLCLRCNVSKENNQESRCLSQASKGGQQQA